LSGFAQIGISLKADLVDEIWSFSRAPPM
jgi:hypothetical protein